MEEHTTVVTSSTVDLAISAWLDAKISRSHSAKTEQAYRDTLTQFRAALQHGGLDLDSEPRAVALVAQKFASFSSRGKQVAAATHNQRLAILSSFYEYAVKHELLEHNPISRVERAKVQQYANAQPLSTEDTAIALHSIDRTTVQGARDYALLAILLQTGRRLSEVQALQWQDIALQQGKATVTFRHCKGGKVMRDVLPRATTEALLSWLHAYYGPQLGTLAKEAPIWVNLSRDPRRRGTAMGTQSIADVCEKHLGTSKVHSTRHTWAHTMEAAGASPSAIQARLGHESLATTGRYLAQLKQAENKHADLVAAMIGIE